MCPVETSCVVDVVAEQLLMVDVCDTLVKVVGIDVGVSAVSLAAGYTIHDMLVTDAS